MAFPSFLHAIFQDGKPNIRKQWGGIGREEVRSITEVIQTRRLGLGYASVELGKGHAIIDSPKTDNLNINSPWKRRSRSQGGVGPKTEGNGRS
jgi:hypothetical protein